MARSVPLKRLLGGLAACPPGIVVSGIQCDSRKVGPGDCFVALRGEKTDGQRFLSDAARRGAVVAVTEEETADGPLPLVRVPDARRALSRIAAAFYGEPSRRLVTVGITGTKGKTTTSYFAESVLREAGHRVGVLGTVSYRWPGFEAEASRTTPESLDLQRMLAEMQAASVPFAVMEVSSHALVQGRVADVAFARAVFTNLASDHMDYHKTPEAYRDAKGLLFRQLGKDAVAVLNADDPVSTHYRGLTSARVLTYGLEAPADCRARILEEAWDGTWVLLETPAGRAEARLKFVGRHNVLNALAAAALGISLDLSPAAAARGLEALARVPGRLERVPCALPFRVFVDYAHTEESLRSLLATARAFTEGRILLAFGCGGDRDRGKRPRMGAVAQDLADVVVVTSDNPRTEDPLAILEEIRAGMAGPRPYRVEPDRAAAIRLLLKEARKGDTVLLAGKGHERGQVFADRILPFDDREEALKAVAELGG